MVVRLNGQIPGHDPQILSVVLLVPIWMTRMDVLMQTGRRMLGQRRLVSRPLKHPFATGAVAAPMRRVQSHAKAAPQVAAGVEGLVPRMRVREEAVCPN